MGGKVKLSGGLYTSFQLLRRIKTPKRNANIILPCSSLPQLHWRHENDSLFYSQVTPGPQYSWIVNLILQNLDIIVYSFL